MWLVLKTFFYIRFVWYIGSTIIKSCNIYSSDRKFLYIRPLISHATMEFGTFSQDTRPTSIQIMVLLPDLSIHLHHQIYLQITRFLFSGYVLYGIHQLEIIRKPRISMVQRALSLAYVTSYPGSKHCQIVSDIT